MNLFEKALRYQKNGLSVIPVDHRSKKPLFPWKKYQTKIATDNQLKIWFSDNGERPQAMAMICGAVSGGLTVIDFDVSGFYESWRESVGTLADDLPVQRTGGGGYQIFFRCNDPDKNDKIAWAINESEETGREIAVETRGEGGYVIVPPSLHPSGGTYKWLEDSAQTIPVISQAQADALLLAARKLDQAPYTKQDLAQARKAKKEKRNIDTDSNSVIDEYNSKNRVSDILVQYGYLLKGNMFIRPGGKSISVQINSDNTSYHHSTNDPLNNGHRHDPFSVFCHYEHGGDVKAAVKDAAGMLGIEPTRNKKSESQTEVFETKYTFSDSGNGKRLIRLFKDRIRYNVNPLKSWLIWDKNCWKPDDTNKIYEYADLTVRDIYREAAGISDADERKAVDRWARGSETARRKKDMVFLASVEQEINVINKELDADPWLFNCQNVTLQFKDDSGVILPEPEAIPHDPKHLLTKITPVVYDPDATCPKWDKFLTEIFDNNYEMIQYIQRIIGYSLTGEISQQCFFFAHGSGSNGKTIFFNTMEKLFGDYYHKSPSEMIMQQKYTGIPDDIANLKGKRLVVCSEIHDNRRLDESVIKDISGGDLLTARLLYQNKFSFRPECKFFIYGNHDPTIRDTDNGIWRRVKKIPFTVTIPEEKRIEDYVLLEMFGKELSGILTWAVNGYIDFRERGMREPDEVNAAVSEYKDEMDVIKQFIEECCLVNDSVSISTNDLYDKYKEWCENNGEHPLSNRKFIVKLKEKNFEIKVGHARKRYFEGITCDEK